MLTIQPNLTQRMHSTQSFGKKFQDDAIDVMDVNFEEIPQEKSLVLARRPERDVFDVKDADFSSEPNNKVSVYRKNNEESKTVFSTDDLPAKRRNHREERVVEDADFEVMEPETSALKKQVLMIENRNEVPEEDGKTNLESVKNDINETMNNLKDVQKELPKPAQNIMNGFFTVGAAAVSGISVKYGFAETNKIISKLGKKPAIEKFCKNFAKPFKAAWKAIKEFFVNGFEKFKTSGMMKKFKASDFGKKVIKQYNKFKETKFVKGFNEFMGKVKGTKSESVKEATGDVLGIATGVSTGVVSCMGEGKPEEAAKPQKKA